MYKLKHNIYDVVTAVFSSRNGFPWNNLLNLSVIATFPAFPATHNAFSVQELHDATPVKILSYIVSQKN
jgi:hypothetical protein